MRMLENLHLQLLGNTSFSTRPALRREIYNVMDVK
jgi:hypothetical protein